MRCSTFLALAASASGASAHYFFPHLIVNGNFTGYNEYVRDNSAGYMPFKNGYDSTDLRCRTGSMEHAATTGVYKVKAGDEVGFGLNFGGTIQHPGPMQAYLSKAPGDVREYDGSGDWFKIYELGPKSFSSEGIEWGVTNVGNFTFKLPEETPAGQYLMRIEHIGVHGAGDFGGAEFYFNCARIEVESDSTAVPGPSVKIPGLYDGHEPGIEFYMYRPWIVNFTMPGPARWPQPLVENVTAQGVSVAPTATPWTLPAVTSTVGEQDISSSAAVVVPTSLASAAVSSANATYSYASTTAVGLSGSAAPKSEVSELVVSTVSSAATMSATAAPFTTTSKKSRCPPRSTVISTVYVTASA
ncbi:cellulose-growth-specific protein [Colletotrichum filicis]|nr:cellulose-growth-specific protein [Colletotrichum filicis]